MMIQYRIYRVLRFYSKLVRLKVRNINHCTLVGNMFLFQIGSIKRQMTNPIISMITKFLFQIGSIKR